MIDGVDSGEGRDDAHGGDSPVRNSVTNGPRDD
jgi:hypothetical protein